MVAAEKRKEKGESKVVTEYKYHYQHLAVQACFNGDVARKLDCCCQLSNVWLG